MTLRTSEQMLELLKAWAIEFESVEQLEGNRVGLYIAIAKTGQRYVVKEVGDVVWRQTYAGNLNWQEKTEIQYRVMRHVNRRGVPTGHLLTTRDGKGYAIAWDSVFTLMPFISVEASPGFLKPDTVVWSNTGRSYAHLHAALTTFDDPIEIPLLTLYDRYEVKTRTRENVIQGSDLDFKKEFLIDLEPHVSEQSSKLPEQPTIWDAHTGNTCYMDG